MAAPRDMTPGELEVRLDGLENNILAALKVIQDSMVTTTVLDAKLSASDQRVTRLERDHGDWKDESTRAHVQLEADSKARHAETLSGVSALDVKINTRFEKNEERAFQLEQTAKAQKNSKWQAIGVSVLGFALAVISSVLISVLNRGIGV